MNRSIEINYSIVYSSSAELAKFVGSKDSNEIVNSNSNYLMTPLNNCSMTKTP